MLVDSQHKKLKNSILKMVNQAEGWVMEASLDFKQRDERIAAISRVETLRNVLAVLNDVETPMVRVYGTLRS